MLSACVLALTGCSSGSSTIDQLLGHLSSAPILTSVNNQIVAQTDQLLVDFNNIQNGSPGDDAGMTYTCYYDNTVDGVVLNTQLCTDIPNSAVTFDTATGILKWTPSTQVLGNYELKVTGTNSDGQSSQIFQVGVRLKFTGLTNFSTITGTSVTATWTPNPAALGYQIFKLNKVTGLYELYQSVNNGAANSVVITGLAPNTGYTFQVQALDALGFLDGNAVSRSVTTTTLTKLALSPASQTVTSGVAQTIQVQAYDNSGAPETVGGIILTPQIQSGTSSGNFSAVTDNNNGTYSFTFTPITVGTAVDIGVTANSSFFLMNTSHLTIVPGLASSAHSTLATSSATVISGQSVTLTATLKDNNGNSIDPASVVSFSAAGGTSTGTLSTVTNQGGGVYTATYSGVTAGSAQTISVTVNGVTLTPTTTVQVLPGAVFAANSSFTVSSGTVASGSNVNLTATLKDLNNNPIDSASTVVFNKSGGTSTGTLSSVTNSGGGVYTATYTGIAAGTAQTISVNVNGVTLPLSVNIQVVPGAALLANSSLSVSSPTVISGNFVTVTASLIDSNNNPVDSGVTVTFSKSGGTSTGTFGAVSNQGGGVYNIRYTGNVAGSAQTLHVLVNGTDLGLSTTIQVLPGSVSLANSTFTTSAASIVSGTAATLTATLKDLNNNPIDTSSVVTMSAIGGTSTGTLSSVTNAGGGVYTATYSGLTVGSAQTISVFIGGTAVGLSVSETVTPAAVNLANSSFTTTSTSIVSGTAATLTATLKDLNNNPIDAASVVTFSKSGGTSTGTLSTVTNQGSGVYTATYTGIAAGTAQTISVAVNGTTLSFSVSETVTASTIVSLANSTFTTTSSSIVSGTAATLTATLKDLNNNPISTGITVTMSAIGGTSTGTLSSVTNAGGGVYTATYTGVASGSAQTVSVLIGGTSIGLTVSETVTPAAVNLANSSFTTSSATVTSGNFVTLTATLKDLNNNPIDSSSNVAFTATGGTSTGNYSSIVNQGNGVYTATYTGVTAGSAQTLGVTMNTVALGITVSETVNPGSPSGSTSTLTAASATVLSGSLDTITATIRDANNNPISSGITVTFSKVGGTSTGTLSSVTNQGSGVYQINYQGLAAGTAQTISVLINGSALGPSTNISVLPGAPSNALSTLTVSANTVVAGQSVTATATIVDSNNNPISSGILVTFDKFGGTSFGNYGTVVNQGNGVYTATYSGVTAGTAQTISAMVNGADFGPTQTIQVLVGAPLAANCSLTIASSPLTSGSTANITAVIKDAYNNPITTQYTITFNTTGGSSTGTLGSVTNVGGGTFTTTYVGANAGTAQTLQVLASGSPITGLTTSIQVVPGAISPSNSVFTIGSSVVQAGTSTSLSLNLRDANNNTIASGLTLTFNQAGGSSGTIGSVTNSGNGNYSATYTGTVQGSAETITLVVNGAAIPAMNVSATVTAGPPTQMVISSPSNPISSIDCVGPYTTTLKDASNNTTSSLSNFTLALSSTPAGAFTGDIFTDSACTNSVSSLSYPAMQSTLSFYYKSYVPQNLTLTLTPSDGTIAANSVAIQNIAILSWIGSGANFTFSGTGSATVNDDRGGGFSQPYDVTVSGNYLYAVDVAGGRILKYDLVNKLFVGWLGHIGSLEGISSTCSSNLIGDLTPGWCTGGRSNPAVTTVISSPRAISSDSTYIYVASNNRILRFNQSDGSYQGWIGGVGGTVPPPAGQLATCAGAAANTKTPGWCLGGTVTTGTGDGYFNNMYGVRAIGSYLYATDYSNNRIERFALSTGAFQGWVGMINTTAGMSPAACVTAGANAPTPSWCFGGTAKQSCRYQSCVPGPAPGPEVAAPNEGFANPFGIDGDANYLYISDTTNSRVVRVDYTGAFQGWIGYIYRSSALSPTTPAQSSSTYTSTWTTGGVSYANTGTNKGFWTPYGIRTDGTYLYVTDSQHRILRVQVADGQNEVWMGRVSTSPTGGASGCSATPVGGNTPGWCLSGAGSVVGNLNSGFYVPVGIEVTGSSVFVADSNNFRIQQFDKTTGNFQNWIGTSPQTTANWSKTLPTQFARSGIDDGSFGVMTGAWSGIGNNGSSLFIADYGWNRIKQFNLTTGSYIGYIGLIGTFPPSGPAQCVGFTSGLTPFWCTGGGRTNSGAGIQAYSNPTSVAADSTYLYVANTGNARVDRVRISDSQYMGWIGDVNVTPTDGDPSCLTTGTNTATPTWCIGGTAKNGTLNGMFTNLRGIFYDSSIAKLFVVDDGRLMRVDPTTGNMEAAIGHVTAGTGCTIYNSTVPDGWCTNATGSTGTNNYAGFNNPTAVAFDATYIYVTDTGNNRILRYNKSTGAPAGFIAQLQNATNVDTSAGTGGACANLVAGYPQAAPGWCHGTSIGVGITVATTPALPTDGAFNNPTGIWADATYLYIADTGYNRVVRINSSTGAYAGWKGYISSAAGISPSACATAGAGSVTPTWCFGGQAGQATLLGGFDFPSGISGDSNYLYIHDGRNNRIVTVPKN